MDRNYYIQLSSELYRLTLLFPKKDPLRMKMRELSTEILKNLTLLSKENPGFVTSYVPATLKNLEVLESYFELSKSQNWVSASQLLTVQEKYSKITEELKRLEKAKKEKEKTLTEEKTCLPKAFLPSLALRKEKNSRQERILEVLKGKDKIQVWQIKEIFPQVSKRTLRRDFESLVKNGEVERLGERNDTFYQLRKEA